MCTRVQEQAHSHSRSTRSSGYDKPNATELWNKNSAIYTNIYITCRKTAFKHNFSAANRNFSSIRRRYGTEINNKKKKNVKHETPDILLFNYMLDVPFVNISGKKKNTINTGSVAAEWLKTVFEEEECSPDLLKQVRGIVRAQKSIFGSLLTRTWRLRARVAYASAQYCFYTRSKKTTRSSEECVRGLEGA